MWSGTISDGSATIPRGKSGKSRTVAGTGPSVRAPLGRSGARRSEPGHAGLVDARDPAVPRAVEALLDVGLLTGEQSGCVGGGDDRATVQAQLDQPSSGAGRPANAQHEVVPAPQPRRSEVPQSTVSGLAAEAGKSVAGPQELEAGWRRASVDDHLQVRIARVVAGRVELGDD